VEAPALARGAGSFSSGKVFGLETGFSPGILPMPALKRIIKVDFPER
jgi:hypothetical protein